MRVKNVAIGLQPLEEGLRDFASAARSIRHGEKPRVRKDGVYFTSLEALRKVLTPKRLALLKAIREKRPGSVYELARVADRDLKNVQHDVSLLARIGLVTLRRERRARPRVVPRVDYDRLQLQIPVV